MCDCGSPRVWVRLDNNHRAQFCARWIDKFVKSGANSFFVVEG